MALAQIGRFKTKMAKMDSTHPGRGDEPRGDVFRLFKKASLSSTNGDSGTKLLTLATPTEPLEVASLAVR